MKKAANTQEKISPEKHYNDNDLEIKVTVIWSKYQIITVIV